MAKAYFTVRVQLITGEGDYDKLHKEMEAVGFKRTIISTEKQVYDLLRGEYSYVGDKSRAEILKLAKEAVLKAIKDSKTCKDFSLLISKCSLPRMFYHLKKDHTEKEG